MRRCVKTSRPHVPALEPSDLESTVLTEIVKKSCDGAYIQERVANRLIEWLLTNEVLSACQKSYLRVDSAIEHVHILNRDPCKGQERGLAGCVKRVWGDSSPGNRSEWSRSGLLPGRLRHIHQCHAVSKRGWSNDRQYPGPHRDRDLKSFFYSSNHPPTAIRDVSKDGLGKGG
ncbi:Reverse transcriptase domain-containing protein [Aphis craccivora]|uniref:Reverse transcriptase domain-containing protein n=1 Tax=Aphis craccivora TaxID=307492 RepID=A0A6G0XYX8_APHCR|nr:Reverse transcriptase domain-containing protein [Aphis craccivora]